MATMTVREYIDKEAERRARTKRPPTLTDIALGWACKADGVLAELVGQLASEQYDYLTDTLSQKLRECVDELDNALAWIKDEQNEKEGKKHA